jgi:hypothetical protein
MEPIGLTFKRSRPNKYREQKTGEILITHYCLKCAKLSLNRLAADDDPVKVLSLLEVADKHPMVFSTDEIVPLNSKDRVEVEAQLFGKRISSRR